MGTKRVPRFRSAFTLLELLMVLAVMTMIVALGVPSVSRLLARARFKDGVFELQAELSRTRLLSMKTGQAYLFRYLPGTGQYQVVTKSLFEEERSRQMNQNKTPAGGSLNAAAGENQADPNTVRTLSSDVRITGGVISDGTGVRLSTDSKGTGEADLGSRVVGSLTTVPGTGSLVERWSEPIVFYPNGRTSNAVFFLASGGAVPFYSEIALRGFTGSVRVSTIASVPPGSPEFPSVLPPEAFAKIGYGTAADQSSDPNRPFAAAGFQTDPNRDKSANTALKPSAGVIMPESETPSEMGSDAWSAANPENGGAP